MKNGIQVSSKEMISAFLIFFVIHTTQIGVGIHGFQRIVYQNAKHDAWISVIVIGLATHVVAFFMIKMLEIYKTNDLYGIHQDVFGIWIGNLLNMFYILYCSAAFFSILRNYIEVVQTWVFPDLTTWFLSASLLLIVIYTFTGGLRVIVGVSFFSFVLGIWLILIFGFPLKYVSVRSLLPILETDIIDILKGAQSMTFTVIGFEILNIIYPFLKEKDKVKKNVHLALLVTNFMYVSVMLVTLTYFSGGQIGKLIWATLSMFSIVQLPFIERFEFLAICFWMIIILPNLCLYLWAAYRGTIRLVKIRSSNFVWLFSIVIFMFTLSIQSRAQINTWNNYFSKTAFYIVFVYPLFLYMITALKKKFTLRKEE